MKKTVYLTSKQDGLKLHVLLMEPEEEPKGIVQIVHGMAEHKERYEPFMEMLCKQGYISIIHDHRGHGKSIRRSRIFLRRKWKSNRKRCTSDHSMGKRSIWRNAISFIWTQHGITSCKMLFEKI